MKKLIYLVLSVLFAISGIYGIYDTITTPKYDLATSIMTVLLLAFLAWLFMHLFLKPEPRHKHQATNAPESSPEASSDAPTVETAPITHVDTNDGVEDDYVAIDIETTGLGRNARIIELGAVRIRRGRKVASYSQLVNPQIPIPAKVTQITGITDRDVRHQPTIDKALPRFYAFCGRDTWIGHNIRRFDIPVIAREAQRVGAGMPDVSFTVADTYEVWKFSVAVAGSKLRPSQWPRLWFGVVESSMVLVPLVAARHKEYDMDEARFENEALSLMEKYSQEEDF